MNKYLVGVDIGGTKTSVTLASIQGIIARVKDPTIRQGNSKAIPQQLKEMIRRVCKSAGIFESEISDVGIAAVGPFRKVDGLIRLTTPNLAWREVPLEENLIDHFSCVIANDCVAAVVAEKIFGAGQGFENVVYVTWSTGIGTGAIVEGHLIHGKNGNAPHGGHIYLSDNGALCGCGQKGDLESLCSGPAIAKAYGDKFSAEDVFAAYRHGDAKAVKIIHRAAKNFGRGLASINNLLDTEIFIIGGSVFFKNQEILLPLIRKEFYLSLLSDRTMIVQAELGEFVVDIAALSLVIPDEWKSKWQASRPWANDYKERL